MSTSDAEAQRRVVNRLRRASGQLTALIGAISDGQRAVQAEAMKLSSALTNAPKARGRWGEQQLKNLLETCGLSEHTDFSLEHSIDTDEGRLRPDAIVRVPGGKVLVIDAKVSLNAYQEAFNADNDEARGAALEAHVRNRIQGIEIAVSDEQGRRCSTIRITNMIKDAPPRPA